MPEEKNVIGEKMKYYRKLRGMLQEDLAAASGINISTIKKYESGHRNPKMDQIIKIADALNVSANAFLGLEIKTVSDAMAVLMNLDESVGINWTAKKDKTGKHVPGSISLSFDSEELNTALAEYLDHKDSTSDQNGPMLDLDVPFGKMDEQQGRLLLYNQKLK